MSNAAKITTPGGSDNGKTIIYNSGTDTWDLTDVVTAAEAAAGYQPLDSDLTAIAALTTTSFGRSLLAAANAAALRTLAGTVIGTDVPSQTAFDDHLNDTTDAHDASAVSFSATGTIAGTDVQTAVAEVATDAATALAAHEADTTSIHGITDTSTLVTLAGSQTLTNKTLTTPALTLKQSAAPTPTAEGDLQWDTDDNQMKVGDGSGTKTFSDDSVNRARANHTGTQTASTISDFDEAVDDRVGVLVVGGTGITATYNDGAGTHTIATTITQYTDEMARDALGAALVAGSNITITPNDGADTITIAASGGGGSFDPLANDAWFAAQFWS